MQGEKIQRTSPKTYLSQTAAALHLIPSNAYKEGSSQNARKELILLLAAQFVVLKTPVLSRQDAV
jgi:hypothetical protein